MLLLLGEQRRVREYQHRSVVCHAPQKSQYLVERVSNLALMSKVPFRRNISCHQQCQDSAAPSAVKAWAMASL
jgi:hypothetical protein